MVNVKKLSLISIIASLYITSSFGVNAMNIGEREPNSEIGTAPTVKRDSDSDSDAGSDDDSNPIAPQYKVTTQRRTELPTKIYELPQTKNDRYQNKHEEFEASYFQVQDQDKKPEPTQNIYDQGGRGRGRGRGTNNY